MHVRIAWEIYHHQQKQQAEAKAGNVVNTKTELLRPPGHLYPGNPTGGLSMGAPPMAPPFTQNMPPSHPAAPPPPPPPHPVGFLSTPGSHLGKFFLFHFLPQYDKIFIKLSLDSQEPPVCHRSVDTQRLSALQIQIFQVYQVFLRLETYHR